MSLVWLFKALFSFSLILASVIIFQYIGSSKLDFFLIGLTSVIIGLVFFTFYESAIRKNKKLFIILLSLTVIFFSLFSYKKLMIAKDRKIVSNLINKTKELKNDEILFNKLIIEVKGKEDNNANKTNEKDPDVKKFNDLVNTNVKYIRDLIDENIRILSSIHNKQISGNDKIRIEKSLLKNDESRNVIKGKYEDLKNENARLTEKLKKVESDNSLQNNDKNSDIKNGINNVPTKKKTTKGIDKK